MADDPRTVTVRHATQGEHKVTSEVAGVLSRRDGWEVVGAPQSDIERATAPLKARIAELEAEVAQLRGSGDDMPEKADERVDWIGQDPGRARRALDDENERGDKARTRVIDHSNAVLAATTNKGGQSAKED